MIGRLQRNPDGAVTDLLVERCDDDLGRHIGGRLAWGTRVSDVSPRFVANLAAAHLTEGRVDHIALPDVPGSHLSDEVAVSINGDQVLVVATPRDGDLRRTEPWFEGLADVSPQAIQVLDPSGTTTYISPASTSVLGFTPADLIGRHFRMMVHPADQDTVQAAFSHVLLDPAGQPATTEFRVRRPDGQVSWVQGNVANHLGRAGLEAIVATWWPVADRPTPDYIDLTDPALTDPMVTTEPIPATLHDPVEVEEALRAAIERGELVVEYQPRVDVGTGRVIGAQAIIRWPSPAGLHAPAEVLDLAEATGLIEPLGAWVIDEVAAQVGAWRAAGRDLVAHVSISPAELAGPSLLDHLERAIAAHALPIGSLCIEVSPATVDENVDQARAILTQIRRLGVQVALEDFGADHHSLALLRQLPCDALTLDRSLTDHLVDDEATHQIVEVLVQLCCTLGVRTTAVGVDTVAQLQLLAELGCDGAQGSLIGPPGTPDELRL